MLRTTLSSVEGSEGCLSRYKQRSWMNAGLEPGAALNRFAVDVEHHRPRALDDRVFDLADAHPLNRRDGPVEQPRERADCSKSRALLEHHQVEQTIVCLRAGSDAGAVTKLRRVGQRDEEC